MNYESIGFIVDLLKRELDDVISKYQHLVQDIEFKYGLDWHFSEIEEKDRISYVEITQLKSKVTRVYENFVSKEWV